MKARAIALGLGTLLAAGCAADGGDVVWPGLGGKADLNEAAITEAGALTFGEPVEGEFDADFQFFGYRFEGLGGASVDLEILRAGSSSGLDTSLFVYGPPVTESSDAIGFDDNAGYGKLSLIDELVLPETGEYLVVVGTATARGRGAYRLELRCNSERCLPEPEAFSCELMEDIVWQCIRETVADDDTGEPRVSQETIDRAWELCTGYADTVGDLRDNACFDYVNPPAWCGMSAEEFFASLWPPCLEEIANLQPGDFNGWD